MIDNKSNINKRSAFASWKVIMLALLCLLMALPISAQLRTVRGTVVDTTGEPVIGANVRVAGTTRGTITDIDGVFSIEATAQDKLTISFIGYTDATVTASNTNLTVTLKDDTELLDEVVVVGYGTQKKATLTGAVSAINNEEMIVTKNENVVNMLSGKIPGVRIVQQSSQPGKYDNKIDIRGMGDPLIVVDGVPRDKDYFSRMDANEIDNVSVLKDASAAIYGLRAANGVILVTTKGGSASDGKFDITFSANFGWQQFLYTPETANAVDHMLMTNEKIRNDFGTNYLIPATPQYSWPEMMEFSTGRRKSTNWTDELFNNNVPQSQYNVSVNGGSDKIKYFFNLGYLQQEGSYKSGSLNYDRWNFRSNVDAQITKRLKAVVQLSGYMDERNEPFTDIWSVYKDAWTRRPNSAAWVNGDHNFPSFDTQLTVGGNSDNPVATTDSRFVGYRREKRANFNGSLTLQYDIPGVEGLSAKGFYSYDYYATNNTEYKKAYKLFQLQPNGEDMAPLNRYADDPHLLRRTDPTYGSVMQLSLNYAHQFGDHNIGALLLFEEQYENHDNFYAQRDMLLSGEYLIYGEAKDQIGASNGPDIWDETRRALVGKINYDWKGRYMVEAAFRYDGASKFPKDNRWGFFPSVSAGWRISEEAFMKQWVPFMNNLKLRASYGALGDDYSNGHYPPIMMGYELNPAQTGWMYDGELTGGLVPLPIPNPNLTWLKATTFNVGLDFGLWNQKLTGTFEFFRRHRTGLFRKRDGVMPGTVGASLPNENIDSDETFGWEISLGHRNRIGDVNYWVNGQISATKNRYDYYMDGMARNSMDLWRRAKASGRNKDIWWAYEEGGRFSNYNDIRYHNTIDTELKQSALPGDYWYEDWNGDGVINDDDKHPVANFNLPVFNYGIFLGADWKGIDLSMNWSGAAGVYNAYGEVFGEVAAFQAAILDRYKDRWHTVNYGDNPWNPNTQWVEGKYPATGHKFNRGTTGILNTSYLRLKSLEIGYTLPKRWIIKAGIKDLRVYVNAYNLLTITGLEDMDPERPGATEKEGKLTSEDGGDSSLYYRYPVNRTFNVGATIKF